MTWVGCRAERLRSGGGAVKLGKPWSGPRLERELLPQGRLGVAGDGVRTLVLVGSTVRETRAGRIVWWFIEYWRFNAIRSDSIACRPSRPRIRN